MNSLMQKVAFPLLLGTLLLLGGCGQKGPLYLPDENPQTTQQK